MIILPGMDNLGLLGDKESNKGPIESEGKSDDWNERDYGNPQQSSCDGWMDRQQFCKSTIIVNSDTTKENLVPK